MTDRTDNDNDALPPPDYVRHITHGLTHIVGAINYYTADTVRRLIAEARAQEREALREARHHTLPPPDLLVECAQGFVSGYTVATVLRLLAERDERIARLTDVLDVLLGHMNIAVHKTPEVEFITDDPDALRRAMVNARAALGDTHGR